ncbi:hypothetical protein V8G54_032309 [Vigna mungo]|uniref:Uncharacterized protein n=1 Tax=Vigna mungo TaxID=3915 RepID=A0AAQ3RGK0_VIGMU
MSSLSFLFDSCCMDSKTLVSTFLSSVLSACKAFLLSSSTFSYSSRVISLSSGSFSSASLAGFSLFPSAATSLSPEGFSSPKFLAVSFTSSVAWASSSVCSPQFPLP